MATFNSTQRNPAQVIDLLFAHVQGGRGFSRPAPASGWDPPAAPAVAADGPAPTEASPPPLVRDAADLRAANDWLQRERRRLQEYTQIQMARIEKEHLALVSRNYLNEQTVILRCQELSRKEELLAQQVRVLQQQTAELSRREQAVASRLEEWSRVQHDLANLCQTRASIEQDTEQLQTLLGTLRAETTALQASREASRAELEALGQALRNERETRAKEQALVRAHQAQMEQRLRELDETEQVAQRRVAELDELEVRLRDEFEEQERQLAEQRREIAALNARLRRPLPGAGRGPHDLGKRANQQH